MNKHPLNKLTDESILAAYSAAETAGVDFALKAIFCGLALREKKAQILNDSPCGHSGRTGQFQSKNGDGFGDYLKKIGIPERSARRYIESTERIAGSLLGFKTHDLALLPLAIDVDSEVIPLSSCLTFPDEKLSGKALEFKQSIFQFMEDKNLAEAVRACMEGESDPSRITRAAKGKATGGKGNGDRKDFSLFIARKLSDVSNHFSHHKSFSALQKSEVQQIIRGALLGEDVSLKRGTHSINFDFAGHKRSRAAWPREIVELVLAAAKERLKEKA